MNKEGRTSIYQSKPHIIINDMSEAAYLGACDLEELLRLLEGLLGVVAGVGGVPCGLLRRHLGRLRALARLDTTGHKKARKRSR